MAERDRPQRLRREPGSRGAQRAFLCNSGHAQQWIIPLGSPRRGSSTDLASHWCGMCLGHRDLGGAPPTTNTSELTPGPARSRSPSPQALSSAGSSIPGSGGLRGLSGFGGSWVVYPRRADSRAKAHIDVPCPRHRRLVAAGRLLAHGAPGSATTMRAPESLDTECQCAGMLVQSPRARSQAAPTRAGRRAWRQLTGVTLACALAEVLPGRVASGCDLPVRAGAAGRAGSRGHVARPRG